MRREYMKWRARDVRSVIVKHRAAEARPPRPPRQPFRQPFAQRMVDPSFSEQRKLENLLWPPSHAQPRKAARRGSTAGRYAARQAQARERLIEDYLEMYHVAGDFITTEAALNQALEAQFALHPSAVTLGVEPQTYAEIVEQVESGVMSTAYDFGYAARIRAERRADVIKALTGSLAGGKAGAEEVMDTIKRAVREQERMEGKGKRKKKTVQAMGEPVVMEGEISAADVDLTGTAEEVATEQDGVEAETELGVSEAEGAGEAEVAATIDGVATEQHEMETEGVSAMSETPETVPRPLGFRVLTGIDAIDGPHRRNRTTARPNRRHRTVIDTRRRSFRGRSGGEESMATLP